jgi:hypothetical protein
MVFHHQNILMLDVGLEDMMLAGQVRGALPPQRAE